MTEVVGQYALGRALGKGTYGCVYEGVHKVSLEKKAVKKISYSIKYENIFLFFREISILKSIQHFAIIELEDVIVPDPTNTSTDCIYLVTELFDSDLRWWVKNKCPDRKVPVEILKFFVFQIGSALEYLHQRGIMHRDLKPQNILVSNETGRLKIADFGLSKFKKVPQKCIMTHEIVTLWYRAPEVILGAPHYDESIDMWSVGVILAELLSGTNPFNGRNEVDTLMKIFGIIGTPNFVGVEKFPNFSKKFPQWSELNAVANWSAKLAAPEPLILLVNDLLKNDPKNRITAKDLMKNAWFKDLVGKHDWRQMSDLFS